MEATRSVRTPGHEGSVERSRSRRDEKDSTLYLSEVMAETTKIDASEFRCMVMGMGIEA
jgi:hypothetical protein